MTKPTLLALTGIGLTATACATGSQAPAPPPPVIINTPPAGDSGLTVLLTIIVIIALLLAAAAMALGFLWASERRRRTDAEDTLAYLTGRPVHPSVAMTARQLHHLALPTGEHHIEQAPR